MHIQKFIASDEQHRITLIEQSLQQMLAAIDARPNPNAVIDNRKLIVHCQETLCPKLERLRLQIPKNADLLDIYLNTKHRIITLIIESGFFKEVAEAVQILLNNNSASYNMFFAEDTLIGSDRRMGFIHNILARQLFEEQDINSNIITIKHLLNHGADIVLASYEVFLEVSRLYRIDTENRDRWSPEQIISQKLGSLFFTTSQEAMRALKESVIKNNYFHKNLFCHISNKPPTIPVLFNGQLFDLFHLIRNIEKKPNCKNPHAFYLNGVELDTRDVRYWPQYFKNIEDLFNNKNPRTNMAAQALTLTLDNRMKFASWSALSMLYVCSGMLLDSYVHTEDSPRGCYLVFNNVAAHVVHIYLNGIMFVILDSETTHRRYYDFHRLEYLNVFNHSFTMFATAFYLINPYWRGVLASVKHYNECVDVTTEYLHTLPYICAIYVAAFSAFVAHAILKTDRQSLASTKVEPQYPIERSFFQQDTQRNEQRRTLLLCFNRLVAEKRAPMALLGGTKEEPDLVGKILDFSVGPRFSKYKYHGLC